MNKSWKDSIYLQREELARTLREPMTQLAEKCTEAWDNSEQLNAILMEGFASIPFCTFLYCVGTDGIQISDSVGKEGLGDHGVSSNIPTVFAIIRKWPDISADRLRLQRCGRFAGSAGVSPACGRDVRDPVGQLPRCHHQQSAASVL